MLAKTKTESRAKGLKQGMVARRADECDEEVGRRIRSRRLEQRLSQTDLAKLIGVTFQQVQKYEKGVNRVGAGRLQRVAVAMNVPIGFFFGSGTTMQVPNTSRDMKNGSVFAQLQSRGSVRMVQAMHVIENSEVRRLLVDLAEAFAKAEI